MRWAAGDRWPFGARPTASHLNNDRRTPNPLSCIATTATTPLQAGLTNGTIIFLTAEMLIVLAQLPHPLSLT
jgi:hypothetical protein